MSQKEAEPRVLFVNPCLPTIPKEVVSTPFGIAWMTAVLKENGFRAEAVDMQVEPSFDNLTQLLEPTPLVVGVAHTSNFSMGWAGRITQFIREKLPTTPIVAGGVGATYEPNRALLEHNASAVVLGEGERTFLLIAQRAAERGGHLTKFDYEEINGIAFPDGNQIVTTQPQNPICNLDTLPLPDRSIYKMSLYPQGAIITSRGCSHRCAYCSSSDFWHQVTGKIASRVRLRSADNVLQEITQLKERYQITSFYILDDVFTYDRQRTMAICQGLADQRLESQWACLARADQVDPEMLLAMKTAGCHQISYGLESANDETLKRIGKGVTSKQIGQAIQWSKEAGLRTRISVIFGMPGDTPKEIRETVDFLKDHRPHEIQLYALMPYPGSRWGNHPERYGIRITQPDSNARRQDLYQPFAQTDLLPASLIVQLADEAIAQFSTLDYVYLSGNEEKLKGNYEFAVSSAFTPIQTLDQYANISGYAEILQAGPLPCHDQASQS